MYNRYHFILALLFCLLRASLWAQEPLLTEWKLNTTGATASYWQNTGNPNNPNFTFFTTNDSADVLQVCFTAAEVFVRSEGMVDSMGQFTNPGAPSAQDYTWEFPRNPAPATNVTEAPIIFAVGVLINGVPIFGMGDGSSWDGQAQQNSNMGDGIWNGDAWYGEGATLDDAYAAHPQQQGAYHSHATPFRLYDFPSTQHSPIVGFAFDGYPIYGPYGYSDPNNPNSAIAQMQSSYRLRNITVRETLPDGTVLNANSHGPAVSMNHPLGEYIEDYEYVANLGDLDEHNGRFCITPDYPNGTYAYFTIADANNEAFFPYFIGPTYYGVVTMANLNPNNNITIPGSAMCDALTATTEDLRPRDVRIFPSVTEREFRVEWQTGTVVERIGVVDLQGRRLFEAQSPGGNALTIQVADWPAGLYHCIVTGPNGSVTQRIVRQH
ncbi:MAG: YHYH protein [Bacteroidota bacterium]